VPRGTQDRRRAPCGFRLGGYHPLWPDFPDRSANRRAALCVGSYNPAPAEAATVWANPLSLATTRGVISFPQGTKMFQFPWFPPSRLCVHRAVPGHSPRRVSPFGHPRI
jgi:hypothetical protein